MSVRTTHLDAEVRAAMPALGAAAKKGLGDPALAEPVQIRASQLNQCAYCLDMHLPIARGQDVPERRLDLLSAWEEAGDAYTERERAALALTEALTVPTGGTGPAASGGRFVPDDVYRAAAEHFDGIRLAHLIALITAVNGWNRLMVTRRIPPGSTEW
ncbi:alkyl hydroperoxide reductase AhpD [Streptomyces sulfonofaciens]|uniref:Alkyl hydroperoxide reductase AhpD n=1 Tax=Streptomyces sulfonofaciens TaxID=68272 RepID=A0A919G4L6_9ACTN|nr:carboxymuconolactone decarboxylase family protein [Streptomyces sulfonofaciens]GHH77945.1 alkyl hydroperoxide reductase AhpD [Streptomyces sulfonofaciens]